MFSEPDEPSTDLLESRENRRAAERYGYQPTLEEWERPSKREAAQDARWNGDDHG